MLVATFLGVFIIPGNFTFMQTLGSRWRSKKTLAAEALPASAAVGDGGAHL
jgi:hypothetical protein